MAMSELAAWLGAVHRACAALARPLDDEYGIESVEDLILLEPDHIEKLCDLLKMAPAKKFKAALEALDTVGDVEVFKVRESAARTTWTVTFTTLGGPTNLGNLPLLAAEFDNRKVWDARAAPTVDKLAAGCCEVALSFNGGADFSRNADPTAVVFSRDGVFVEGGPAMRKAGTNLI